jgi:PEP-CTERM motif
MAIFSPQGLVRKVALIVTTAAFAAVLASAPSAAKADVVWDVDGTFENGDTVTGYFDIDVYGFLDGFNLQTSTGSTPDFDYTPSDSYFSNGTFFIDAQPQYQSDLHLTFADSLTVPTANNPLVPGQSWDCQGSFSCFVPADGTTTFIRTGFASAAPEPSTWLMMLVGVGGIGAAMRLARRQRGIAIALS